MDLLNVEQLRELLNACNGTCLSLYMPTYKKGKDSEQNHIRLKNLLAEAERQLDEGGMRPREQERFLRPVYDYLNDPAMWRFQDEGLAIFLTQGDVFRIFQVPIPFEEIALVNDRFHFKPLFPLFSGNGLFYVLALTLARPRLFACSHFTIRELEIPDAPKGIEDTLKYDVRESHLQFHNEQGTTVQSRGSLMFHGHGGGNQSEKSDIERYCRDVDHALHGVIHGKNDPLLIAGVEPAVTIYRETNTYPHLSEEKISVNPEVLSLPELNRRAWDLMEGRFREKQESRFKRYRQMRTDEKKTGNKYANEVPEVVRLANNGRVDTLFVVVDKHVWGRFDPDSLKTELHEPNRQEGDEDLLDTAALQTILHGGEVYAVQQDQMPDRAETCAILRF